MFVRFAKRSSSPSRPCLSAFCVSEPAKSMSLVEAKNRNQASGPCEKRSDTVKQSSIFTNIRSIAQLWHLLRGEPEAEGDAPRI
jgi:hypothetical protein